MYPCCIFRYNVFNLFTNIITIIFFSYFKSSGCVVLYSDPTMATLRHWAVCKKMAGLQLCGAADTSESVLLGSASQHLT